MKMRHPLMALALLAGLFAGPSSALAQGAPLFAVLNGGNEVNGAGQANQGDLDGYGSASIVLVSNSRLCFTIIVVGTDDPTAAHIHVGRSGVTGPIVVGLVPPKNGARGASSGCLSGIDPADIDAIRKAPSEFYVNVHTGTFPAGELCGQLLSSASR